MSRESYARALYVLYSLFAYRLVGRNGVCVAIEVGLNEDGTIIMQYSNLLRDAKSSLLPCFPPLLPSCPIMEVGLGLKLCCVPHVFTSNQKICKLKTSFYATHDWISNFCYILRIAGLMTSSLRYLKMTSFRACNSSDRSSDCAMLVGKYFVVRFDGSFSR